MNSTEQEGKRKRRFFAARLGIEEEDEEIHHTLTHQVDLGAVLGDTRGGSVILPQWLHTVSQGPAKTGTGPKSVSGESALGLDSSALEAMPQQLPFLSQEIQSLSQDTSPSGAPLMCRSGLDRLASSKSEDSCVLWSMITDTCTWQTLGPLQTPRTSNRALDLSFPRETVAGADALEHAMITRQQWNDSAMSLGSGSFAVEDPCWETLLGDLVVDIDSDAGINDPQASTRAPFHNSSWSQVTPSPSITPLVGTEVSLVQDICGTQEGLATPEKPHVLSLLGTCEVPGSGLFSLEKFSSMHCPVKDTEIVASCKPGHPPARRGDTPQQPPRHCSQGPLAVEHARPAEEPLAQAGGNSQASILTGARSGSLQVLGAGLKSSSTSVKSRSRGAEEIPKTSWMLLGGHMWDKGFIPDLNSLSLTDAEGDYAASAAERASTLGKASENGKSVGQPLAKLPMERSRELVCQPAALSKGLKATLGCLQERDKKRKLVEGALVTTSSAQSGLCAGFPIEPLSVLLASDHRREGVVVAARDALPPNMMRVAEEMRVPGMIGGGGIKDMVFGRFLQAATALDKRDKAQLLNVCSLLRPHANRLGTAAQRVTDLMLNMLTLKAEGQGVAFLKKPVRCSAKEAEECLLWHHSALPTSLFSFTCIASEILPKLVGRSKVHIVSFGDTILPFLPILIRILACQTQEPRLKSLKVTTVSYFKLLWRYSKKMIGLRDPSRVAEALTAVAAECGIDFEYQGIELEDRNLGVLRTIHHQEDTPVAAIIAECLKYATDSVGKGALTETMKCLVSLRPLVVTLVEADVEASQREFVPRFMNTALFMWDQYQMHDDATTDECKPIVQKYDQLFWAKLVCNLLACEGSERRMCPRSRQGWQELFESWGFAQQMTSSMTLHAASRVVHSYPRLYSVQRSGKTVSLSWKSVPLYFMSTFAPKISQSQ